MSKISPFLRNTLVLMSIVLLFTSCNREDDICESGEATPRIKLKFKTQSTGKLRTLDSVFVKVDYGNGSIGVFETRSPIDSLLLPLRVDDSGFTDVYIGTSSDQFSLVRFSYTTQNEYVSPACGIKRNYTDISGQVTTANPVVSLEKNQNEITDEEKTHFFLLF